jgi:glutaminyl-peptide cyclotransferase
MKKCRIASLALVAVIILYGCNVNDEVDDENSGNLDVVPAPINLSYQIINQFSHDTSAFTEGLAFHDGKLFESTGSPDSGVLTSGTWVASIDLKSGKYDKKIELGKSVFGEGITFLNGRLYQLTYRQNKGFVYDAKNFKKLGEFSYKGEGWGLTNDGKNLIMSNGTSNLYYLNPDSLTFIKMLAVQDNNGYVSDINELEYINGFIYANRWLTGNILKIDPATGYVVGKMDLSRHVTDVRNRSRQAEEMNGIAYDSSSQKTYITGKKWPVIYEIKW